MNSLSHPPRRQSQPAAQLEFQRQVEAWRQLLFQCGQKPSRKGVHSLRVATLRLQAGVEYWLRDQEPDAPAARAGKRWNKQGKKLRRALNPVREADVSLARLASLRASTAGPPEGQLPCSRSCLRQIGELEQKLTEARQKAAKRLITVIADRRKRMERLSTEMEDALALSPWGCSGKDLLAMFASLREEFPELKAEILHTYRKCIKNVRYLADISAVGDSSAARQAAILKKMQAAAGEWHDWQALASQAGRAFRGKARTCALTQLLEARTQEYLKEALGVCLRATAQLFGRDVPGDTSSPQ
jgi:CHAD domain-containing protein